VSRRRDGTGFAAAMTIVPGDEFNTVNDRENGIVGRFRARQNIVPRCRVALCLLWVTIAAGACARAATTPPVVRAPQPPGVTPLPSLGLPPIPPADGPLRLDVVYPPEGGVVAARDSTFVFGSTGSGRTQLTINGVPVRVEPNGAFLAFLPVPPDGVYHVQGSRNGESGRLDRTVRVPPPVRVPGRAEIVPGSAYPTGSLALRRGESLEVGFRGAPGGRAFLRLPSGERIPLIESRPQAESTDAANFERTVPGAPPPSPVATYRGVLTVDQPLSVMDTAIGIPRLAEPTYMSAISSGAKTDTLSARLVYAIIGPAVIEFYVDRDSTRQVLPLNLAPLDPARPRVGIARAPAGAPRDWTLRGRHSVAGPFDYFWPEGTRMTLTGERNGMYRVGLAADRSAWVPTSDVQLLIDGTPPPRGFVSGARMAHSESYVELRVALPETMPFRVDEEESVLHLSVFGATSQLNFFQYGGLDALIDSAEWSQPADDVLRFSVHLTRRVWGYETFFDAGGALVLRIRRPPQIDSARPLAGLRVAVDPGHPPAGAIGPTRLTEAEANLAIALELKPMLEAAGAHVIMTRKDGSPVELGARPLMARDSNAHVLVSIHNNAFPDGVNPFTNNGTSVYYFQRHSVDLAKEFQRELLSELKLRDLGVGRADLALVRPTWVVSALTETSFMMVPQQESGLRDPSVHERIARAHLRALEAFLRGRAGG
jgi:N-acetylmuramoyl-L-alanine amidase